MSSTEPVAQPTIVMEDELSDELNVMNIQAYGEGLLGSGAASLRGSSSHEEDDESEEEEISVANEKEWRALPMRAQLNVFLEEIEDEAVEKVRGELHRKGSRAAMRVLEEEINRRGWNNVFFDEGEAMEE